MYNAATRLYNELLKTYFHDDNSFIDSEKEELDKKYELINLFLREYDYSKWYEESHDEKEEPDEFLDVPTTHATTTRL